MHREKSESGTAEGTRVTRYLFLTLVLAGCVPSPPPRGAGSADNVPADTVLRVEVTLDEAEAIRARTIYAGAFMRYHAFVSDTDTVEFWHEGRMLATIDGQGVISYAPVILSMVRLSATRPRALF